MTADIHPRCDDFINARLILKNIKEGML